jgi:hypothetical protein
MATKIKILLFICLTLFASAEAQDEEAAAAASGVLNPNDYTLAYKNYLAEAEKKGYLVPSQPVQALQNTLFAELEAVGLLSDTNRQLYLFAQQAPGIHRLNMVKPGSFTLMPSDTGTLNFEAGRGVTASNGFHYFNGISFNSANVADLNDYTMGAYINALCDTCSSNASTFAGFGFNGPGPNVGAFFSYSDFGDRLSGGIRSAADGANTSDFTSAGGASDYPRYLEVTRYNETLQYHIVDTIIKLTNTEDVSVNTLVAGVNLKLAVLANYGINAFGGDTSISNVAKDQVSLLVLGNSIDSTQRSQLNKSFKKYLDTIKQVVQADTIDPFWRDYEADDPAIYGLTDLPIIPGRVPTHGMQTPAGSGRNLNRPDLHGIIKVVSNKDEWEKLIEPYNPAQNQFGFLDSLRRLDPDPNNDTIPVTVLFDKSGTWQPDSNVHKSYLISKNYVTWAFHTAPSPGIRTHDYQIIIKGDHHYISHWRHGAGVDTLAGFARNSTDFPGGWTQYGERDCLKLSKANFAVVDHCTFSFATDELLEITSSDVTLSNNMFAFSYDYPFHHKGKHAKGIIILSYDSTQSQRMAMYRNLFHHTKDRHPQVGGGVNIVNYDLFANRFKLGTQVVGGNGNSEEAPTVQSHRNLLYTNYTEGKFVFRAMHPFVEGNKIYLRDFRIGASDTVITNPLLYNLGVISISGIDTVWNRNPETNEILRRNILPLPYTVNGGGTIVDPYNEYSNTTQPDSLPGYNFIPSDRLKKFLTYRTGARPLDRDPVEKMVELDITLNIVRPYLIDDQDYLPTPINAVNTATWTIPTDPYQIQPSGYTKLEEWLHDMAAQLEKPNP